MSNNKVTKLKPRPSPPPRSIPRPISTAEAVKAVSEALNGLLADSYALYLKTKNFHWHVSGPHFRDYHLLLDEQAADILAPPTTWPNGSARSAAPRCARSAISPSCRPSRTTTRSSCRRPMMLRELMNDNKKVAEAMRKAHEVCDDHDDIATASLIENWIDQTEKRTWFLFEAARGASNDGH